MWTLLLSLQAHCTCAQMHLLSVYMEPILHLSCPHNCEDFLSWLPPGLAFQILSYLDPGMISLFIVTDMLFSKLSGYSHYNIEYSTFTYKPLRLLQCCCNYVYMYYCHHTVSLCRCSQVCYSWFNMSNDPKLWMKLCR